MKKRVLLFQPFLRVHILNFGEVLKNFEYVMERPPKYASSKTFYKKQAGSAESEFARNKITSTTKIRRLFGVLNVRFKWDKSSDLLFTYGCLLITNKPYCVYIENGVTLFNYDVVIARNPLSRLALSLLVRLPQCRKLIFMSETARKSFFATARLSKATRNVIEKKSVVIYPLVKSPAAIKPKTLMGGLRLLFTGVFYMKGGIETLNAFDRLRNQHPTITLTVITPLHLLRETDKKRMEKTPGITLCDASFNRKEMEGFYRNHDIFLFPTFRDTFGLVLIEAMSFGLPIVGLDQYAVAEIVTDKWNGFLYPNHPLTDYNRKTHEMYGKLYNAKAFYNRLFQAQAIGETRPIEDFLVRSFDKYLTDPTLLEQHSRHSLEDFQKRFGEKLIAAKIEKVFTEATAKD